MPSPHADWANARVLCGAPPAITSLISALRSPSTLGATTATVRAIWAATDANWVSKYAVERQVDGVAWASVSLPSATTRAIDQSLTLNHTYRYRIQATDGKDNISAWLYDRTMKPIITQNTSTSVKYSGPWRMIERRWGIPDHCRTVI